MSGEARIARVKQKAKAVFSYTRMAIVRGLKRLHALKARDMAKIGVVLALVCLLVTLPFLQSGTVLGAATHLWTTNADFLRNKAGLCGATALNGITVSGAGYTDSACATNGEDASIRLNRGVDEFDDVKQVTVSGSYSMILKQDGTVWAWGNNSYGQLGDGSTTDQSLPVQVRSGDGSGFLTDVKEIATDNNYALALKQDGTVWAWGSNSSRQLGDGSTTDRPLPIQVHNFDGSGFLTDVKQLAAGYYSSIALKQDGTVWAWGNNSYGQLGDGSTTARARPVQVRSPSGSDFLTGIEQISTNSNSSIALKQDGTVWAWGYNVYSQLGDGSTTNRSRPVQVQNSDGSGFMLDVKQVVAANYSTLILKQDGTVWVWGYNGYGQLGDGSTTNRSRPVQVQNSDGSGFLTGVEQVAATSSGNFSIALKQDGTVWAWGYNEYGQLGDGSTTNRSRPVQVQNSDGSGFLTGVKQAAVSSSSSIALKQDGTVWAWGNNSAYRAIPRYLNISTGKNTRPVKVVQRVSKESFADVADVAVSSNFSLALKQDGTVWAWGYNTQGQLGDGSTTNRSLPVQVRNSDGSGFLTGVKQIEVGSSHSLALKQDGTVWAWGRNNSNQLGDGSSTDRSLPVQVRNSDGSGFLTGVKEIVTSSFYSFALKQDGTVWAWGYNYDGQLGDNSTTSRSRPVQVQNSDGSGFLTDVKQLFTTANGNAYSIALKQDGTVWAWGDNGYGQLGNGSISDRRRPVQVRNSDGSGFLTDVKEISVNSSFSLALKQDGTVWAWGYNAQGQLGDGSTTNQSLPVQVRNTSGSGFLTGVRHMVIGSANSLALKQDGTVWAWGYNTQGQLGDGSTTNRSLPVQVRNSDGSGFLTGVKEINTTTGNYSGAFALKQDGTVWAWGGNSSGRLGDGSTTDRSLPVQVRDSGGSGFLTDVKQLAVLTLAGEFSIALKQDGTVRAWGYNASGQLGNGSVANESIPIQVLSYLGSFDQGYVTFGSLSGAIIDMGVQYQTKWYTVGWNTEPLPTGTTVSFAVRTSQNGQEWSDWTAESIQSVAGSTSGSADIGSLPFSRFLEVRTTLKSPSGNETPVVDDFSVTRMNDINPPEWTYPEAIPVWTDNTKSTLLTSDAWERRNNQTSVYADWSGATEPEGESGISNYYVYFGPDSTADPITAGVDKGLITEGSLELSNNPGDQTYYIRVSVKDKAGNVLAMPVGESLFKYKFDQTQPLNPTYVSVSPFGWATTNDFTFTWPSGVVDPGSGASGVTGFQYKRGGDAEWSETQTSNSVSSIQAYQDGKNEFLVRSVDAAGNVAEEYTSVNYYYNGSAPRPPENLQVTPASSMINRFTFTWDEPDSGNGVKGYYYSINAQPTANNSVFTTELSTGAIPAATQQGFNTLYVVAIDNSDQINWGNYASVQFEANTAAPGVPGGLVISDSSNRVDENWALTLNWSAAAGAVHRYHIYRSSDGVNFAKVAETSSVGYLDSGLSSMSTYYYKVQAVDNAGSTGIFSSIVSRQPTGKFTEPPLIVSGPTVKVSATSAVVTWVTNRPSSSFVSYSKDESFSESKGQLDNSTQHEVVLSGLEAATSYNFKVQSLDEDRDYATADAFSSSHRLKTDVAPGISEVTVSDVSLHSALVSWKTTTVSSSRIQYGTTTQYGQQIQNESTSGTTTHTMRLANLSDSTSYNFKIDGTDTDGNILTSDNYTFATLTYPRIFNVRFEGQSDTPGSTLKVTWESNVPTTSSVQYFEGSSKQQREVSETKLKTKHSMLVAGLKDDTVYRMIAQGRDAYGNLAVSDTNTVRTDYDTRPPVISNLTVETTIRGSGTEARGQIVVSWTTDEPATSQVAYGQGSGLETLSARTAEDEALSTEHVVIISDLPTSQVYTVQPISHDKAKNDAGGETRNAIVGRASDSVLVLIVNVFKKVFGW